ncbi:MAG: nucleotidyltransferase domain-containing protein [Thermodesulfobacteriota bacterium]|nr:nucleotidyltransferase domain-containing protein [Thermodesulfobacteriota bacterium]
MSQKYNVESIGIFGSYIRSEETQESDLDLLVDFTKKPGLIKYIELEIFLTGLLGIKVDLLMQSALGHR